MLFLILVLTIMLIILIAAIVGLFNGTDWASESFNNAPQAVRVGLLVLVTLILLVGIPLFMQQLAMTIGWLPAIRLIDENGQSRIEIPSYSLWWFRPQSFPVSAGDTVGLILEDLKDSKYWRVFRLSGHMFMLVEVGGTDDGCHLFAQFTQTDLDPLREWCKVRGITLQVSE